VAKKGTYLVKANMDGGPLGVIENEASIVVR